jgi:hypothetical protein
MADRHIPRKPRIKGPAKDFEFWCFYHKRFFEEGKKFGHCIPKKCFEFDYDSYLERMGLQQPSKGQPLLSSC